jgi:hypothetical protein
MKKPRHPGPSPQRGAAALIVVLLLFFIVSLVAAYAGRNLIFEQRTSTNQYRATQAFEVAEAGLEWAVAMLNGGRVTADCIPPDPVDIAQPSFRQRYIDIDDASGNVTPVPWADGVTAERPSCVKNGAGWNCSCPAGAAPTPAIPAGGGVPPGFRVCFEAVDPPQPGVVRVVSTGGTSFDDVDRPCEERGEGTGGAAAATVSVVVALSSALATPPSAALTVRGDMTVNSTIQLRNRDRATNGITANVGGVATIAPIAELITLPGTPVEASILDQGNDASLSGLAPPQMFASLFRMAKENYKHQPAAVRLDDCAVACSEKLSDALQANRGRMIWVDGDMTIESNVVLGSAAEPVVIVATGNIKLDAASIRIYGLIYSQAADWDNDGLDDVDVWIQGAAVAEGNFIGDGKPRIWYDPAILNRLKLNTGSFVRVPGSWRDFP